MMRQRQRFHFPPLGIRMQLTLWYTSISALLLLLFGIAFYSTLQAFLASSFDVTLQMRSQQVAEAVSITNGKIVVDNMVNELPELASTAAIVDSFDGTDASSLAQQNNQTALAKTSPTNRRIFVRVFNASGQLEYSSPGFSNVIVPADAVKLALQGTPWYGTIGNTDDQEMRVYSTMLIDKHQLIGVVQVGQSLTSLKERMQRIALALMVLTPFALLFSALGCYWLAGRAFNPIHRLTRIAREITVKNLHQRVPVPPAHDEVRD